MKRKKRGWIWFAIVVAALVAAALILPAMLSPGNANLNAQRYEVAEVIKDDILVTVHGTGSIEALDTSAVFSAASGRVEAVYVEDGDSVAKGQPIASLESDALKGTIDTLKEQIVTQDATIAGLRAAPAMETLTAPVDGRVMAVYAQAGDDAVRSMSANGALMVLSTDGRMKVEFEPASGASLAPGAAVKLEIEGQAADGFLMTVPDGSAELAEAVVDTDEYALGADVVIRDEAGAELGRGKLEVSRPLLITAYTGTVDHLYVEAGDEVKRGNKLVRLDGATLNPSFEAQLVKRQQLQDDLDQAYTDLEDLTITAPADGIVTGLTLKAGGLAQDGAAVCTLQQNAQYKLVVAVDELDIPQIQVGQKAEVSIDALPGQTAAGEVIKISPVGTKANDVTTFDVTLKVDAPAGAMVRMSASADVEVAFKSGALLVPVEAVYTVNGKTWVYGALPGDIRPSGTNGAAAAPGSRLAGFLSGNGGRANNAETQRQMIEVKVGLISDAWAEILDGLQEGDEVAVPATQNDSSSMFGFGRNVQSDD